MIKIKKVLSYDLVSIHARLATSDSSVKGALHTALYRVSLREPLLPYDKYTTFRGFMALFSSVYHSFAQSCSWMLFQFIPSTF